MSFGDLTLRDGSSLTSEATGTPASGENSIGLGFSIDNPDNFTIEIVANGPSVTDVSWTEPVVGDSSVTVDFTQNGTDTCYIMARQDHSIIR